MNRLKSFFLRLPLNMRFFLVAVIFGILPLVLFSGLSFLISKRTILDNAMTDLLGTAKKNNELIEIQLKRIEESALIFTVDKNLKEHLLNHPDMKKSEQLHHNLDIKSVLDQYFISIPGIFSYHLYTDYFMMVGNYPNAAIPNYKPPMYVPYDEFRQSSLFQMAKQAKGKIVWVPTYRYEEMYGLSQYEGIQYDYPYLFSAIKQINCDMEKGREKPILIVSFRPDFLGDILEASELAAMDGADFFLIDEDRNIVYAKEDALLSTSFDRSFSGIALGESGYELKKIGQKEYIIAYDTQALTGWKQVIMLPSTLFTASMEKVPQLLFVIGLLSSFFLVLLLKMLSGSMTKTLQTVLDGMKRLGEGKFMLCIPETEDHDMKMLVNKFNEMDGKIHRLIVENYEIKLKEKETQIMALNMQMNPHFLYNTLNTVNMMAIESGKQDISDALVRLSQMLQRTLQIKGDRWTVKEELSNLDHYLYIMNLRYDNAFCVEIDVQEELLETKVPLFMLLPFVENSVIHGFAGMEEGGVVKITGKAGKNGKRNFLIWDNGKGIDKEENRSKKKEEHHGLNNLKNRLFLIYGEDYFMKIGSNFPHGTVIYIVLPPEG